MCRHTTSYADEMTSYANGMTSYADEMTSSLEHVIIRGLEKTIKGVILDP